MAIFKNKYINNYRKSLIIICKENRLRYKMTQKELAKSIGVSQGLISCFERGKLDSFTIFTAYVYMFDINF